MQILSAGDRFLSRVQDKIRNRETNVNPNITLIHYCFQQSFLKDSDSCPRSDFYLLYDFVDLCFLGLDFLICQFEPLKVLCTGLLWRVNLKHTIQCHSR